MATRRQFLEEIRRLEEIVQTQGNTIVNLELELDKHGEEAQSIARASMEVREEDVEQLTEYQQTNTKLVNFVEKVAASKRGKFAAEARKLLGM